MSLIPLSSRRNSWNQYPLIQGPRVGIAPSTGRLWKSRGSGTLTGREEAFLFPPPLGEGKKKEKGACFLTDCFLACHQISEGSTALWINTFLGVSTLSALWTIGIIFRQARLHLGEQNIGAKFVLFQVTIPWERKDG